MEDYTIDEDIRNSLDEKRRLFGKFAATKWWEESNFSNILSRKVKESRGFKLSFLNNSDLEQIIIQDYDESKRCLHSKNYKATVILCGAIIEAILTAVLDKKEMVCFSDLKYNNFLSKYPHAKGTLNSIKIYFDKTTFAIDFPKLFEKIGSIITDKIFIDLEKISIDDKTKLRTAFTELKANLKKLISTKKLYGLALANLTDTVKIFGLINDKNIFSYIDPLRDYRNAIHPGVQIRKTINLDYSKATIAIETVNLLVEFFNKA